MFNLNEQIKFLIVKKLNDRWKHLKIVFSGSDVPGEGEHKILEFIRNIQKKKEIFNPDWTFMIYGAGWVCEILSFLNRCRLDHAWTADSVEVHFNHQRVHEICEGCIINCVTKSQ
jgi:hypothetical protein